MKHGNKAKKFSNFSPNTPISLSFDFFQRCYPKVLFQFLRYYNCMSLHVFLLLTLYFILYIATYFICCLQWES